MQLVKVSELDKRTFKPYGQLIEIPVKEEPDIKTETVRFWKQQAISEMGKNIEVGVLKVKRQKMRFNELENHFKTPTILISLDGDFILSVAPAQKNVPKADEVVAFEVPKFQVLVLAEKCWHSATYPIDRDEITLLVIFKENSLENDTIFKNLDQECQIDYRE